MHFFIDHNLPTQSSVDTFAPESNDPTNKFNITSRFQLAGQTKAFACQDSLMIVQQSPVDSSLVNVILKPIEGLKIPFKSVKYFVYRGLLKSSFISGTDITPQATSNSEFIARFWTDWNNYKTNTNQTTLTDPTPQTFCFDNSLAGTLNIEKIYDNSQTDLRALLVKEGEWFGDFGSSFKIGFEIITEADNLILDLDFLRAEKFQIDVTSLTGLALRAKRELVLSFIDPAAFFGLHYDVGVNISTYSGNIKTTEKKKQNDIYSFLLDNKFETRNTVYLDIRSEKGCSYNFYKNYDDGSGNNIKIGNSATTPTALSYSTNDWPIIPINIPLTTAANNNDIKINLRIDDNTKPILFFENADLLGSNNRSRFLRENEILNGAATDWSNDLMFKFPNTGTGSTKENVAYYVNLNYFRQEFNSSSPDTVWKNEKYFDNLFGPLSAKIFDNSNVFGWIPFNEFVHTAGNLPQITDSFGSVGTSGCYFDSDSVVFYFENIFSYESAREPYPLLTASIVFDNPFFKNIRANNLVINYDLFLDPATNDEITAINIDKYDSIPSFKENLFFLILKKNEFDELSALSGFSPAIGLKKYISLEQITDNTSVDYLTDLNGNKFNKYKLKVTGFDSSENYHEEYPINDLIVYSGDGLAFASMSTVQTKITKGEAWTHQHLWNDTIINQNHINNFGSDYFAGMKYKDGLHFRIKSILEKRLKDSQVSNIKIDCADLCLSALVEFASFYGLPLLFQDYRTETSNRILNSKSTQYNSVAKFVIAVKKTYGAATLFSPNNKFMEDVVWSSIEPSDVMTWKSNTIMIIHPNQTFHANTITELTNDSITVIQGSLEDEQPTPIEKKNYDRNNDGSVDPGFWKAWFTYGGSGAVKARRWKFNVFDNA